MINNACQRRPLTPAQIDIWLEQSVHPQSTEFNLGAYYAIPLALEIDRFLAAVNWAFSHYDAMHARLTPGPEGMPELVFDSANAPQCEYLDLSGEADAPGALQQSIHRQARTPFRMLDSALARPLLVKTGERSFCYVCTFHHIILDGYGVGNVFSRIARAYETMGQGLAPQVEGKSYADYLDASREPLDERSREKALAFWEPLLARPLPALPPAHACSQGQDESATAFVVVALSRELADRVSRQAAAANATLYHALLLACGHLIGKQYSLESCALSQPILNRSKEHRETIGHFTEVRIIPLPLDENASVGDNLHAIARRIRGAFRHYRIPAAELARRYPQANASAPAGHGSVSYVTNDFGASIDGVFIQWTNVPSVCERCPFTIYVLDTHPGKDIRIELVYQLRQMNRDEAGLFAQRLPHLLECFAQDPGRKLGELDLVPPEERGRIAAALRRDAGHGAAPLLVIDAILERARRSPDAIAVETGEARRSYRECIGQAQAMAHSLVRDFGVRPGDTVALLLPRGADLISSQLAVMLAGGAFVPMDPRTPDIRARQIAEDSGVKCVITNAALVGKARVIHREALLADTLAGRAEPFPSRAEPEQVAYIIYTSGSTGKPKGVEISQRALADHLASWFQTVPLGGDGERHLLFHSAVFDASIEAIFPALMRGHTLVAAPHPQWTVYEIARVIVERRLTVLFLPPAYLLEFLKHLRDHPGQLAGHTVRLCLTGGETMHAETAPLWNEVFGRSAVLFNIYGPTECTVTATMFKVPAGYRAEPGESIPIGQPHRGRVLRIVDAHDRDVPLGAEGELLIGGIGLARGYRNLPAETAERFVVLADGRRYYRSGDIVRLKTDGNIVFRRRLDQQVKVRGFRIEPGEIEACVLTHPAVRECAVVARQNGPEGACELRAYVALREASGEDRHSLREYLSSRLPDYMLPAIFILDRLPKNAADKIDRPALLAEPVAPAQSPSDLPPDRRPNGAVQEYLALLWEQALGAKVDDVRADFFEIGGHSLLAAKLISSMGKAFRVEYPFSAFFDQPTIAETERRLEPLVGDRAKLEKMARVRLELARMSPAEIKARLEQTAPRRP